MAEIDKVKEQIGWLKIVFGLLVAIDVSLFAWITQNISAGLGIQFFLALAMLIFITVVARVINHSAQKMIDRLEGL